jgi:hypothetical protein
MDDASPGIGGGEMPSVLESNVGGRPKPVGDEYLLAEPQKEPGEPHRKILGV